MRSSVARAAVPTRLSLSQGRVVPAYLWMRAVGLPGLGAGLGAIATFTTFSMADHLYATLGTVAIVLVLVAGALRSSFRGAIESKVLRRVVDAAAAVDTVHALSSCAEGARVRIRGVARTAGLTSHGWLVQRRGSGAVFDVACDFWLVDAHGGRTFVEASRGAKLLGPDGLRDGDTVEVAGTLGRHIDRTLERLDRELPLRPIVAAGKLPLVVRTCP